MVSYSFNDMGGIEIDFDGVKPPQDIRKKMKDVKYQWNPNKMIWWAYKNNETIAVAKEICGEIPNTKISKDYALKVKIKDIIDADVKQLEAWKKELKDYVNKVMREDNTSKIGNAVSDSQESVWMNCFKFIASTLKGLTKEEKEFKLIFEYSLPGTVHERPDVFLLTDRKVISLEFKRKESPQVDDNKDRKSVV